jgi:hypothetical protein
MTAARIATLVALCSGLAFWLGRATGRGASDPLESRLSVLDQRLEALAGARSGECLGALAALGNHRGSSPQEMEQAVAKALASGRPPGSTASATGQEPAEARPPSEKEKAAMERGQQILAGAVSKRRWTPADAEAFHQVMPDLDTDGRHALMTAFARAVNNDQLVVEAVGPPF